MKLILSLTTYPKRWDYLQTAISSILKQTYYDKADLFYINIDDNLTQTEYEMYNGLAKLDDKIRIKVCPAKWKSCNKLIWVYKEHPNDVIVCFDDDKNYPPETLEQVYDMWKKHPECIVAQEINPIVRTQSGDINYINSIDVMLNQIEYGKYLSNGCLFPPNSFSDLLFDYDEMMHITNGNHDELWFWLVSTLNGVPCIGLDYTYSHSIDEGVCLTPTESDLTNINNKKDTIDGYNFRINAKYKDRLNDILMNNPVKFFISHDSILKLTGNISMVHALYGNFPIQIYCDKTIVKSWISYLSHVAKMFKWTKFQIIPDNKNRQIKNETSMKKNAAIVTFVYKPLTEEERKSLQNYREIFRKRDIYAVVPENIDETVCTSIKEFVTGVIKFDSSAFESKYTYQIKICWNPEFYRLFQQYEYILIAQTDAWAFRDELDYWCELKYDYIGAPWCSWCNVCKPRYDSFRVGNGGFSLRKVNTFINKMSSKNDINPIPEDVQICKHLNLNIPPCNEAIKFSIESGAEFQVIQKGVRPMGCHDWKRLYNDKLYEKLMEINMTYSLNHQNFNLECIQ